MMEFDETEEFDEEMGNVECIVPQNVVLGDLYGNADKILADLEYEYVRRGRLRFLVYRWSLHGGDLGFDMQEHVAFKKAMSDAEAYLMSRVREIDEDITLEIAGDDMDEVELTEVPYSNKFPRKPFHADVGHIFNNLSVGLRRRLQAINCKHVVIGISGGLDSTLVVLVAAKTFNELGYDKRHIHVYTMPGFGTSGRTRGNAEKLCRGLGLTLETIPIAEACRQHFRDIGHDENVHDVVYENVQARERTQILMDKANQVGGIVLGTGDMSEIALGWSTYNGDHMSMFAVNAGVPKTTVRDVCAWWAKHNKGEAADAVNDIVATPVSPELLPGKDGEIAQKTEDKVGPYELHDFFLFHFIERQRGRRAIVDAAVAAFEGDYDRETIEKWLDVFFTRFFTQAFKRNCQPDGIPIFSVYLSPERFRVPSGFSPNVFLRRDA